MTTDHDLDRRLDAFLLDGPTELPEASLFAVRDRIDTTRQRAVIGPWRLPTMNKLVPIGLAAVAVVAVVAIASQVLRPSAAVDVGSSPSAPPAETQVPDPASGVVRFRSDGAPASTELDVVYGGASVSGSAVTRLPTGTHTVRIECATRDGDTWAVAGTVEQTTIPGEQADTWSAVIVKDGSPQRIGIWISDPKSAGTDCAGWLAGADIATIEASNFTPIESGSLEPPPVGAAPSASGKVLFVSDGRPATTELDAVYEGESVSGTAVTTIAGGTHTVRLGCAARDGETWAVAGTVEETTVPGERAEGWSAVIVKEGSPQRIGIWLSDPESAAADCAAWLAAIDFGTIGEENFMTVQSGSLVPPPTAP